MARVTYYRTKESTFAAATCAPNDYGLLSARLSLPMSKPQITQLSHGQGEKV